MNQLKSPIAIVTGDKDLFAPALDEQIKPFTWLPNIDKYLVIVKNSTHFSFISEENSDRTELSSPIVNDDPAQARSYLRVFSVAFFKTYLAEQKDFKFYLTQKYFKSINKQQLPINLLRYLNADRLTRIAEQ